MPESTSMNMNEADHVRASTDEQILQQIDRRIAENIRHYATRPKEAISQRIQELDHEWDIERYLETSAASLALSSLFFGLTFSRKWLLLTGTVLGFLLQHAVQGWCPPVPLLRRLGVRTRGEIDREKYALKVLRGDFQSLPASAEALRHDPASDVLRSVS